MAPRHLTPATTVSSNHQPTFTTIIEADHNSISRLAQLTIQPNVPWPTRLTNLTTLVWRLIRHDISEELIMRPAFTLYLGPEGATAAAQDRTDHADLKRRLVALYETVVAAEGDVNEVKLVEQVKVLAAEMAEHMREESGIVLPRFERVVDRDVSVELGRRYVRTLVLTPDVTLLRGGSGDGDDGGGRVKAFRDVLEYAKADFESFEQILRTLSEESEEAKDGGYLEQKIEEEMIPIGLQTQTNVIEEFRGVQRSKEKL